MEVVALDISLLLISLIVATAIIILYSFSHVISSENQCCVGDFPVIDIVRHLKKLCPVSFDRKWKLLPLNSGLSRCWTKTIQFPGFQSSIHLCGVASAVPCSSVYAFSLIADVSKWGEWDYLPAAQCLLLKSFTDKKLQRDHFMLADQVVGIQRGTNVQSYVAKYRFMSFPEKTVKWILFWNIKKLEFIFFLIQPAVSKTAESQCLITQIFGSKQLSPSIAINVAQRLKNIKEFLQLSQLNIIASNCAPSPPAISLSLSQSPSPNMPHNEEGGTCDQSIKYMFMLVPISQKIIWACERLKGFYLTVKNMDANIKQPQELRKTKRKQEKEKVKLPPPITLQRAHLKRTQSESYIKPKINLDFKSNLELNTYTSQDNSATTRVDGVKRRNSIIVEEALKLDLHSKKKVENQDSPEQQRSFSDPVMPSTVEKQKSPSQSSISDIQTDEEIYVHLHIIHENESNDKNYNKNDLLCTSTSEFELTDSSQQFLDCKMAGFLTQGNYGASELQAEMLLASEYEKTCGPEETVIGKWGYHSNYKGMTVLSKLHAGKVMKILSFLCQIELSAKCNDVWKCLKNPRFRFMSDETVKTVKIVERISESQKLIHVYHEVSSGLLRKEGVDFCLLQTEREEASHFYSSFQSIEYEKCPFMTSVIRGTLRPSGWVVERLGPKKCKVTYLMQILVNSPDSLFIYQLSTLMPMALLNLKSYIASLPS